MEDLTKRQLQVLDYIILYMKENGFAPSIRDIMRHFEFKSPRAAHKHLIILEKKGYLEREGVSRGIRLTPKCGTVLATENLIPVSGKIAAGNAIEAIEKVTDFIPIPSNFFPKNFEYFSLRVEGNSMIEAHIKSGDYVIVRKQDYAEDGDIIVALIDKSEATLKRMKKINEDEVLLIPENKSLQEIRVSIDRLEIQGKMVGLIRLV
ncbi:MAG: transcriptional repressor LexA [Defluviitoga tunisiensis]|uniref:LexA repressor n=1 Tax=Defluviitoga tunisiensis TaxID=1006576 RepID=A0A0C7NMM1_DEFTU|nr:transcriptional repressor LexA [Defluviitoga tunisiensis]MDD3600628.1 transcriptional repressor LexA [Defluviitoga tunisiensis]MDY0379964.1 transcriptional repressor LexA [Defluviitoga tunisiensis]CEP79151.1 LexA repressor [Defluviitoga tunisiensis]HHV01828.1 transcriptional repressor LexA [Defluviitoga tunisiensis]HOB55243.1 transcriptional repressor LexA [Defluviitoga tunisiensis]